MPPTNILLMGLRASGKTTLGQMLATRLKRPFVDLDDVTAARLGCVDVPEAWARHGPAAFRAAEVESLREVLENEGQVIALGGGTPTAPGGEDVLRAAVKSRSIRLVYLRATPETLRARLALTDISTRPSLTGEGLIEEVQRVFDARDPVYRAIASEVIEVDGLSEDATLRAIRPGGESA
jgi:shikimate kinase